MFKRIMCFIIIFAVAASIAACGGGESEDSLKDRNKDLKEDGSPVMAYVEKEINKNSDLTFPAGTTVNSKNQLVVNNAGTKKPEYVLLDADGKTAGKIKCDFEGTGSVFTLDSQDNLYIVSSSVVNTDMEQKLYVVNPDGKVASTVDLGKISLEDSNGYGKQITGIALDSNGNVYLSRMNEDILVLDKNGSELKTIGDRMYQYVMDIDGDNNLVIYGLSLTDYKYVMEKLDTSTGKSIWKQNIDNSAAGMKFSTGGTEKLKCGKSGGSIYLLTDSGVEKFDSEGNYVERILDFKAYTILASGYGATDMNIDDGDNFYVITAPSGSDSAMVSGIQETEYEIYRYSLQSVDENAKNVIRLSVPASDRFMEVAVSKFNKANPDYRIEVQESGSNEQSGEEYDRYVNSLNTELMSGKGPDIIAVTGLPYEKYISKNAFSDLTEVMSKDREFNIGDYYTNVFDAMKYNGKLYTIPVSLSINAMFPNSKALDERKINIDDSGWTWENFRSIADKLTNDGDGTENVYVVPPDLSCIDMLKILLEGSYGRFIDINGKKSHFDSEEFIGLLNMAKSYGNNTDESMKSNTGMEGVSLGALFDAADRGTVIFSPQSVSGFMTMSAMKTLYDGDLSLMKLPGSGQGTGGGAFTCNKAFAINNNSKYKEKSWKFIEILLSADMQSMDELYGFAVNKAAQKEKADNNNAMLSSSSVMIGISAGNGGNPVIPLPLSKEELDVVERYIESLSVYSNIDRKVTDMILNEAGPFFSGDNSAEEAARTIQSKVGIYLGE